MFSDYLDVVLESLVGVNAMIYIIKLFLLAIVGSILLMLLKIPDILDTFKEWRQYMKDRRQMKKMERGVAYYRSFAISLSELPK